MFEAILTGLQALSDRMLQWCLAIAIAIPIDALIIAFNRKTFEELTGINLTKKN